MNVERSNCQSLLTAMAFSLFAHMMVVAVGMIWAWATTSLTPMQGQGRQEDSGRVEFTVAQNHFIRPEKKEQKKEKEQKNKNDKKRYSSKVMPKKTMVAADAAVVGGQGSGQNLILTNYLHQIRTVLENIKYYPVIARKLKHRGVVTAVFTINAYGKVGELKGINGAYTTLQEAVHLMITKMAVFPPFPPELWAKQDIEITVPINFNRNSI